MDDTFIWIAFVCAAVFTFIAALATIKGYPLIRIRGLNLSRLRDLQTLRESAGPGPRRQALDAIILQCKSIRNKWILTEDDLNLSENTLRLVGKIAAVYHPGSKKPLDEARVGALLKACEEIKNSVSVLTRMKGVRALTQFRLRHLYSLAQTWKWKTEWEASPAAKRIRRYKLYPILKWVWTLFRCMDLAFWSLKMLGYIIYDVIFKILLAQWYLIVGELALQVYSEEKVGPEISNEEILRDLEDLPEEQNLLSEDLPEAVRAIAAASRKSILLDLKTISREKVREIYFSLVADIAGHYHPQSGQPLREAKMYDLLLGAIRFAGMVASLESTPALNKFLAIRISHILMVKNVADFIAEHPLTAKLNKYRIGDAIKYAALAYRAISKRHPGVIVKDLAFSLAIEGGKRWFYVYLHDKIVLEANAVYAQENQPEGDAGTIGA